MTRWLDRVFAWGMVILGAVHCLYTFAEYKEASGAAMWFFSGGLALMYAGALNLVRIGAGKAAAGWSRFANVSLLLFAMAYAARRGMKAFSDPQSWFLFVLLGGAAWFSFRRK